MFTVAIRGSLPDVARLARLSRRLSVKQAAALGRVKPWKVQALEHGGRELTPDELGRYADGLGVPAFTALIRRLADAADQRAAG